MGCLRDGSALSREQLAALQHICADESTASFGGGEALAAAPAALATPAVCPSDPTPEHHVHTRTLPHLCSHTSFRGAGEAHTPGAQEQQQRLQQRQLGGGLAPLIVNRLGLYVYSCRSLERLFSVQLLPLAGWLDPSPPSAEEQRRVSGILAEPAQPGYLELVAKPGSREGHYRGDRLGVTLAHPLLMDGDEAEDARLQLAAAIVRFRARVDAELPGLYAWFDNASLHVTLRAVIS